MITRRYYRAVRHDRTRDVDFCIVEADAHVEYRYDLSTDSWIRLVGQPIRDRVFWGDVMTDDITFADTGATLEPTPTPADIAATQAASTRLATATRRRAARAQRQAMWTHPAPTTPTQKRSDWELVAALDELAKNPDPTLADIEHLSAVREAAVASWDATQA